VSAGAFRLAGRVAVVTGASSGIGRAIALRLVADGAQVTAVGRDKTRLDALPAAAAALAANVTAALAAHVTAALAAHVTAALAANVTAALAAEVTARAGGPGRISPAQVDLTDDEARAALVAGLLAGPRVDVVVHSAGEYANGPHADAPLAGLDTLYQANVRAPYALTQELLPALRTGGGDVIVINSSQGLRAGVNCGQFAATQQALKAFTDSLRQEVNADGVRVCSIHPGRTATPRQERLFAQEGRPYPGDLLLQPEDVAEVVATVLALPPTAEVTDLQIRPAKKGY
jgi:NADP-dependent 3-hydroxy acid dehydrogenase YdfG